MTVKKNTALITSISSVVLATICFLIPKDTVCYDILLAVFGSDSIAATISIIEYFSIKREAIEEFYVASLKALSTLSKLEYIHFDLPDDIIKRCFAEERNNNKNSIFFSGEKHEAKQEFLQLIGYNGAETKDDTIDQYYKSRLDEYRGIIFSASNKYIALAKADLSIMTYYFGKFDFFFGNKKLRKFIFDCIYKKILDIRTEVLKESYHFELLLAGKGSIVVCLDKIRHLESTLFRTETSKVEEFTCQKVYNEAADQIDDSLEKLISYTRKGRKANYQKHCPVFSTMSLDD